MLETYIVKGKGITTTLYTSQDRKRYWILPGEMVSKSEAKNMKRYRKKPWHLREFCKRSGALHDMGDFYITKEVIVFDNVSDADSFVLGGSRSGDHAKRGKKTLTGKNLLPKTKKRLQRSVLYKDL